MLKKFQLENNFLRIFLTNLFTAFIKLTQSLGIMIFIFDSEKTLCSMIWLHVPLKLAQGFHRLQSLLWPLMDSHNDLINPDARRDPTVFFPAYKEVTVWKFFTLWNTNSIEKDLL
jgi:hypothetical protein